MKLKLRMFKYISKKNDSNKLENIIIILHNDEYWINNCFYL